MKAMNKLMFSCQEISHIIVDEKELSPLGRLKFKLHLMVCAVCRAFLKQDKALNKSLNQLSSKESINDQELANKIIEKIID